MNKNIAILILAAGKSSRMGRTKQLLHFKGSTLLGNAIKEAKTAGIGKVICVLGANVESILEKEDDSEVTFIINSDWSEGISSTIQTGLKQIEILLPGTKAILIMLADQPFIDATYLKLMVGEYINHPEKIIASNYKGKSGVPALFPKKFLPLLEELKGDTGAGKILKSIPESIVRVSPSQSLKDIDTPEDYNELLDGQKA